MDEEAREVVVDTYAIVSDLSRSITRRGYDIM